MADVLHRLCELLEGRGDQAPLLLVLVAVAVASLLQVLFSTYKAKYSFYKAPTPPLRIPWLFGNVEVVERYRAL